MMKLRLLGSTIGLLSLGALASSPLLTACGTGAAANAVKPNAQSAEEAVGGASVSCQAGSYAEPLVIDLASSQRVDLEAAMNSGVAVVKYDCRSLQLLKDCRVGGDYKYAGVSRKEEVISLESQDELAANLPLSSGTLGGSLEAGRTLDLAMVLVGKRTTAANVERKLLVGSQCDQATHFLRAAVVGAFAMRTGTKGKTAAAAELFGMGGSGKSASEDKRARKDGELSSCEQAKPDSETPPDQCRAALRVELVPIMAERAQKTEKKGEEREVKLIDNPCPDGFELSGGKCTKAAVGPRLCDARDAEECKAECAKGSGQSCYNYGELAFGNFCKDKKKKVDCSAVSDEEDEKNTKIAIEYWKMACDKDVAAGCADYGFERVSDKAGGEEGRKIGVAALEKGCSLGSADACATYGMARLQGRYGIEKDEIDGLGFYKRACKLGDSYYCQELGKYYFKGQYVAKDPKRGFAFLKQFCDQGDLETCEELGEHLLGTYGKSRKQEAPVPEVANAKTLGREILSQSCLAGRKFSCSILGQALFEAAEYAEARKYLPMGCEKDGDACGLLGRVHAEGLGGIENKLQAVEAWLSGGVDDAYRFKAARMLEQGNGVPANKARAAAALKELCADSYVDKETKTDSCAVLQALDPKLHVEAQVSRCEDGKKSGCDALQKADAAVYTATVTKLCNEEKLAWACKRAGQ